MIRITKYYCLISGLLLLSGGCKILKTKPESAVVAWFDQQGQKQPLSPGQVTIEVEADAFALQFNMQRYNPDNKQFHAMRIAAFYSASQVPTIQAGMPADEVPCFSLGTGMAPARSGRYEALVFNPNAHHYLFYDDEDSKRVKCLSEQGNQLTVAFKVDSLRLGSYTEAVKDFTQGEIYLLLFNDANLNRQVDEGEWTRLTLRLKGKYRGWTECYWNQQDSVGQTPLHRLFLLKQWANYNDRQRLSLLKEALKLPNIDLNRQDALGNTALHYAMSPYYIKSETTGRWASQWHDVQLINALLEQDDCAINRANFYYGNTALQDYLMRYEPGVNRISQRGLELIRLFLKRPDLQLSHQNNVLYTAYDYAARKNWLDDDNDELVEQLMPQPGFNGGATHELWKMINQVDFNVSRLDSAFFVENIQLCIDHEANLNGRQEHLLPITALCDTRHRPYGYAQSEIASNAQLRAILLKQLISVSRCNPNARDGEGLSALHHAARNNHPVLLEVLVDHPDTDVNIQDAAGNSPLMDVLLNLQIRSGNDELTKSCLGLLTKDWERLNTRLVNYQGQTLQDIIDDRLHHDEHYKLYASRYPETYKLLEELNGQLKKRIAADL